LNSRGFTLLELIIAIGIFATLSAFVANAISNGVRAKAKIQSEIDSVSRMRDAMKLMEKDINLAYHYNDWELEVQEAIKKSLQSRNPNTSPAPPTLPEAQRMDPTTHFIGSDKSIQFVTMNNARFQTEQKMADFVEVGYELRACKSIDGSSNSNCLWRRQSGPVDIDVTKGGDQLVLLENVTELKFRYLGEGQTDWVEAWDSSPTGGNPMQKNFFPSAIEISLTTQKEGKGKKYSMQTVANVRFPNNLKPKEEEKPPGAPP
jgi:prepilin-type N-terminal cleavage/methylation domain-containing protein